MSVFDYWALSNRDAGCPRMESAHLMDGVAALIATVADVESVVGPRSGSCLYTVYLQLSLGHRSLGGRCKGVEEAAVDRKRYTLERRGDLDFNLRTRSRLDRLLQNYFNDSRLKFSYKST